MGMDTAGVSQHPSNSFGYLSHPSSWPTNHSLMQSPAPKPAPAQPAPCATPMDPLSSFNPAVKKKESKMYGAHFKDVDHTQKATKMTFDSDEDE